MRKYIRKMKKGLSFLLLLALIAATVRPIDSSAAVLAEENIQAAETSNSEDKDPAEVSGLELKEKEKMDLEEAVSAAQENGENEPLEKTETLDLEETDKTNSEKTEKSDQEKPEKPEKTDSEKAAEPNQEEKAEKQEDGGNQDETKAQAGSFESDAPVIEKVEFPQNQKTVKSDVTISLSVFAYDASAISDVRVGMRSSNSSYGIVYPMTWTKGSRENEYICTVKLDGTDVGRLSIVSIEVVDEHKNTASYNIGDISDSKYWVDVESMGSQSVRVKEFQFPKNGQSATKDTFMEGISVETQEGIEDGSIYASFEKEDRNAHIEIGLSAADSAPLYTTFTYSGYQSYTSPLPGGKYILKDIYVERGIFGVRTSLEMQDKESYSVTLETDENSDAPIITSVQLDKNGQNVKNGDTVNITVEAASGGTPLEQTGSVGFSAAAPNIDNAHRYVGLDFDETDHKYHGTLTIEDMYPCEWYISTIDIESGNARADAAAFTYDADHPYYVRVYNGDAFVNPELDVEIQFMALDENGVYQSIGSVNKKNVQRRQTMREIGVTFPAQASKYPGFTQTGWMDHTGREITEDTRLSFSSSYIEIYAKYDKGIVNASYSYPDSEGHMAWSSQQIVFEHGETYGDVLKKAQAFIPDNMTKEYSFAAWEYELPYGKSEEDTVSDLRTYFTLTAKFSGVTMLQVFWDYYDEKGSTRGHSQDCLAVQEGTKTNDAIKLLNSQAAPKSYAGLRFKEWSASTYLDGDVVENGQYFTVRAIYENCLIRYIINSNLMDEGTIFCQVAEKGEKVSARKSFDGFKEVTWTSGAPAASFVVNDHMTFYGEAESISGTDQPSKPSDPAGGSGGGTTGSVSDGKTDIDSENRLPDAAVDQIVRAIGEADPGAAFRIDMGSKTVVPREVLEAARGKDVTLVLDMGGYTWTINGADIMASGLQDIDLRVIPYTDNIPNSTVQALAGNNPCMQITLVHEGSFGFKADLTIGIGAEYSGSYGNLYYHDSAGKMVFINAGMIDSSGNVKLTFSHASDYLIVISDRMMSQTDVPGGLMPAGTTGQSQNGSLSAADADAGKSVKTGDSDSLWLWVLSGIFAIGIFMYHLKRKSA